MYWNFIHNTEAPENPLILQFGLPRWMQVEIITALSVLHQFLILLHRFTAICFVR